MLMGSEVVVSTEENLQRAINRHLELLVRAGNLTQRILDLARGQSYRAVTGELENRERLINIVFEVQKKIERSVKIIPPSVYSDVIDQRIKNWQREVDGWVECIVEVDREILECLNYGKNQAKREISSTHKCQVVHKKYSLSLLKK